VENGQGVSDELFDQTHSQIGSLGQIIIKAPPVPKKKVEVEKKKKPPKVTYVPSPPCPFFPPHVKYMSVQGRMLMVSVPGPGKGNWSKSPHPNHLELVLTHSPTFERGKREESSGEKGFYSHACKWNQ
jgi:hypothetical protein